MGYHSLLREVVILMVALYSKTVKDPVMGHGGEGGGEVQNYFSMNPCFPPPPFLNLWLHKYKSTR